MLLHQYAYHFHVLSRAVAFPNLSTAAMHVKLSQPQLSRIIASLEEELSIKILDRNAKRKASWTPVAHRLAEMYIKSSQLMEGDLAGIVTDAIPKHIRIATLDGLLDISCQFAKHLLDNCNIQAVELDLRDLSAIEEDFLRGNYDIILSAREPGVKKFPYLINLGFQTWDLLKTNSSAKVMSTFDFQNEKHHSKETKYMVSNALSVRRYWIENFGGEGRFPSELKRTGDKDTGDTVLVIGKETLPPKFWKDAARFFDGV